MAHAEDRLAGAILLGDNRAADRVIRLFDRQEPVPSDRRTLLFLDLADRPTAEAAPETAVVCQCNGVGKETILRHCTEPGTDLGRNRGAPEPPLMRRVPRHRTCPARAGRPPATPRQEPVRTIPAIFQSCDYGREMTNRA
ncbi:hypothetical protein [Streptomyces sp. NPDC086782]|uniref:hypothetical protein n=1 Tax=Streptomyces sp. NPDC086782 TaxID=3365757 RepID=UPI003806530F